MRKMREIKFRAWHKKDEVYYNEVYIFGNAIMYSFENDNNFDLIAELEDVILEQYTGLKDKNGVEVYEGDIVKGYLMEDDKEATIIGTIDRITGYIVDIKDSGLFMWLVDMEKLEVIGNIHEGIDSDE